MSTLFVVQFCFLQTRTLNDSESKKQLALVMEIFTVGRLLSICTLTEPGTTNLASGLHAFVFDRSSAYNTVADPEILGRG